MLLTCGFTGVSDGIRTHDIQDHNLATRPIKPAINDITADRQDYLGLESRI
jgi:hypothetical protein